MKRKIFCLLLIPFFLTSCIFIEGGKEPENKPEPSELVDVTFTNNSNFAVNIYHKNNPYSGDITFVIPAKKSVVEQLKPTDNAGDAFYMEYLIPVGNITIPYWQKEVNNGCKTAVISGDGKSKIIIDELSDCSTKSAYIVLENNTTSEIYLLNGVTQVRQSGSDVYKIKVNESGVYEAKNSRFTAQALDIDINYLQNLKITSNGSRLDFSFPTLEIGNIYTFTVSGEGNNLSAALKSVAPFSLDARKKIWSFDEKNLDVSRAATCMRLSDSNEILVMGTNAKDNGYISLERIDEYGKQVLCDGSIQVKSGEEIPVYSSVIDFAKQGDGSYVILMKNQYAKGYQHYLICYNFEEKKLIWSQVLNGYYFFRNDSKNKLLVLEDNKILIVGGVGSNKSKPNRYFACLYDIPAGLKTVFLPEETSGEKESCFTSAYFDGENIFICGNRNWDASYTEITQLGEVWKFSSDMKEKECIYSSDRTLFFSIDGNGTDYAVCGEYTDEGKILKGCYVTKKMIENKSEVALFTAKGKSYCWFNQLCQYKDKIVLCGKAADDMAGEKNPMPFVVAYDNDGNKMWENISYKNYTDALNLLPNSLGTYIIQLSNGNNIHYVSADLLGNEAN